jgi:integrase
MIKKVWSKRLQDWGYKADFRLGKRRVRLPSEGVFASEQQCRNAIAGARAEFARQAFLFAADRQTVSVQKVADEWINRLKELHRTPDHLRVAERAFKMLGEVIPLESNVEELTTARLKEFIERRESKGATRATAFKDLIQIRAACVYAVGHTRGLESWKPPAVPEGIERPSSHRNKVISPEEQGSILAALGDEKDMADLFEICLGTGMRVGEAFGLRWVDVQADVSKFAPNGTLIVRGTKTGKRSTGGVVETDDRPVPMTEHVAAVIAGRYNGEEFVFPKKFDHDAKLKEACRRADIPYGRKKSGGLVFHDTRHTAATRMLQDGVDVKTVAAIMGHSNLATTFIYTHATPESLARAIKALEGKSEE